MLDVTALRTFLTVLDQGGFNAAATLTGKPQSTISMQIRRLEETVGSPVLIRERQNLRPTAAGETLARYARRMVDLHDEAMGALTPARKRSLLRIGTPADYATSFLAGILPSFGRTHPQIDLEVECDLSHTLLEKLAAGRIDVALVTRDPEHGARGTLVRRERIVWAGARDGSAHTRTPLPVAAFPSGCLFRRFAAEAAERLGRPSRLVCSSPALSALQIAVTGDMAVAILAQSTLTPDMRVLGDEEGFAPLPDVEVELVVREDAPEGWDDFRDAVSRL